MHANEAWLVKLYILKHLYGLSVDSANKQIDNNTKIAFSARRCPVYSPCGAPEILLLNGVMITHSAI